MAEQEFESSLGKNAPTTVKINIKYDESIEFDFDLVKWAPSKVFNRLPAYGKILATPLSMYPKEEERGYSDYEQKIAMALFQFFGGLEDRQLDELVKEILDQVYYQKMSVADHMDELFIKCPELLIDLCARVLDIHYSPFLKRGFNGLLTQLKGVEALSRK